MMSTASTPQTASTTNDDTSDGGLPAFTTFQATELETSWDYYERSVVSHHNSDLSATVNSYTRPWEMESKEQQAQQQQQQQHQQQIINQQQQRGFEPFPKLPSFQSQFHSFADNNLVPEPSLPTQVTAVPVPISPSSASPSGGSLTQLTQLTATPLSSLTSLPTSNFHTLSAPRHGYPLVPAPIQARDISNIQQQYIDERHIQLYQPITATATFHHPAPPQPQQGIVTVLKNEAVTFDLKNGIHHNSFQNVPMMDTNSYMGTPQNNGITPKASNKNNNGTPTSHTAKETRKKERRKIRASSLESSTESDASSAMDIDGNSSGNPGQVAAVSSTDNFKSPMHTGMNSMTDDNGDHTTTTGEKQKQKKRKRCGECVGCQKKDNCGECAPCRNDKSHQICKQRRCEKLTEKKIIYSADGTILRGESRRGRGKGRGSGTNKTSYRGRKALNLGGVVSPRTQKNNQQQQQQTSVNSPAPAAVPQPSPNITSSAQNQQTNIIGVSTTAQQPQQQSHQPIIHQIPSTTAQIMKEQPQQPMTPMAFYPTWQATANATTDPSQTWQNQFIQQIPGQNGGSPSVTATAITPLNSLDFQTQGYAYPTNGYVQATGLQFDPNYGRTAATAAYSTPTIQRYEFQAQQIAPINQVSLQSVSFAPNVTYSQIANPVILNHQQHHYGSHGDQLNNKQMTMSATLTTTASGNEMPGYPRVNSVPPRSLTCNGYPGLNEYGGNSINTTASNTNTNTSSSQSNQMHPPATESPSRQQPSRPNSSNHSMYQQQSPSNYNNNIHMSPTSQAQSPSSHRSTNGGATTPNNNLQHYPSSGMLTPTSHHQQIQDGSQDWQNSWNGNQQQTQSNDMFNQSDRINLNTRIKTMILNKNDKEQQQSTGHFLSYSHQHLPEHLNTLSTNNNNNNIEKLTEAGDDGGFKSPDTWKPSVVKQENEQKTNENNSQHFFGQKQQLNEKKLVDPGGGNQENLSSKEIEIKTAKNMDSQNINEKFNETNSALCNRFNSNALKYEKYSTENDQEKQSYTYNSAHEYQQHQNIVNNIKREPGEETPLGGSIKYEGYEKNYQNFIRYADFCDAQQPQYQEHHKQHAQYHQQDYIQHQSQGYYNNYPYQNYSHHPSQNYTQQQNYQTFMSQQAAYHQSHGLPPTHHSSSTVANMTNFEQQIPLHTYPIPKHSAKMEETISTPASFLKKEPSSVSSHPYPYLNDLGQSISKNTAGCYSKMQVNTDPSSIETTKNTEPKHELVKNEIEDLPPQEEKPNTQKAPTHTSGRSKKQAQKDIYNERNNKPEVPDCDCFSSDKKPPEPGSYYTHLGCAATLVELRKEIEQRAGLTGKQLRIEKVLYTGKEGKSSQGCPIAKWVIRRVDSEEKALFIVKRRQGHRCKAAFVVISIVVWDAVPLIEADNMYKLLVHKLNKFGLPTTRRCATNENRTCACQGLDPESCGASYSFGCSWSMYYNGCKYARSKTVRKFRLSVKSEEAEIEERMNILATILSPMYNTIAPKAYDNQVQYEVEAPDCRLGLKTGKPFSGVTCCVDFCAHTHRDLHNMQDGCTVQATLLKPRPYGVTPEDEQLHVLPLYTMDSTDEFDSEEGQKKKHDNGSVQVLEKFPTEVRVRSTPLQPCRRHGKKRGNGKDGTLDEVIPEISQPQQQIQQPPAQNISTPLPQAPLLSPMKDSKSKSRSKKANSSRSQTPIAQTQAQPHNQLNPSQNAQGQNSAFTTPNNQQTANTDQTQLTQANGNNSTLLDMASMIDNFTDAQLQSNQISSTVLDSPYSYDYQTGQYIDNRQFHYQWQQDYNKIRAEEISPDTTTRPGSSNSSTNSNSAFSPNIQQQTQSLFDTNTNIGNVSKEDYGKGTQYHQLETAFVKPKAPEYNPQSYGNYSPHQPVPQHPNNYQLYSPYPYDPYGYNNYNNYSSNYSPYNMNYGQTPTAQSNWGLYPQNSPMPPSATPVIPPHYPPNFQQQSGLCPPSVLPGQPSMMSHSAPAPPKITEVIGEVTEINDNLECFQDKQMGGVAVALPHGSVVIECAKLEMHSTTALKKPNRLNPNRISLIFYQHRNLNRPKHGTMEWAEKMRLKKLGITLPENDPDLKELLEDDELKHEFIDEDDEPPPPPPVSKPKRSRSKKDKHNVEEKVISSTLSPKINKSDGKGKAHPHNKSTTLTTTSWTTLFPMHPCVVTGPYHENSPQQQQQQHTSPSTTNPSSPNDGIQPTTDPLAIASPEQNI